MSKPATSTNREPGIPDLLVLREELPSEEVDRRLGLAYALAGMKHRVVAFYLRDTHARGLHQLYGFRTCAQYAAARFGMSRREARDLLVAGQALRELRLIDEAFAAGKLCWTKVRTLIKVATPQHEAKWLERAQALSTDELALEVRLSRQGEAPRNWDDRKGLPEIRLKLEASMPPDVYAKWETLRRRMQDETPYPLKTWECLDAAFDALHAQLDEPDPGDGKPRIGPRYCVVVHKGAEDGPAAVETDDGPVALDDLSAEVCACGADHVDPAAPDARSDRRIPDWLKAKVLARDGGRCLACKCRLRLDHHHQIWWSRGGQTKEENLLILCRKCHALVHAGLLVVKGDARSGWKLMDPQGREIQGSEGRLLELMAEREGESLGLSLPEAQPGTPCQNGRVRASASRRALRPRRFEDLVGQGEVIADLEQAVEVANEHHEPLGHTLLMGGRGLGKTAFAGVVAAELGVKLEATCGPHLRDPADLVPLLLGLGERAVLLIDEIHALPQPVAEVLYEAMEDATLSLPRRNGYEVGTACHPVAPFTLIGATTEPGALPGPLLSRFENRHWLGLYEPGDLAVLIGRAARQLSVEIEANAARRLAAVSRGTPREALRLLRKARQQARAERAPTIDAGVVARTLGRLGIDERGLVALERAYLETLDGQGPTGIARLSAQLGVDPQALERDHEPYLFRLGLATTTPHGRVALNADEMRGPIARLAAAF